jgi:hypothetical protein
VSQLDKQVAEREAGRCEYCGMHQALQGGTFHTEHILPRSLGGATNLDNLAFACPACNLHKSNRIDAVDPQTGLRAPLFNPRLDVWASHFTWQGFEVVGLTPVGRSTVSALKVNQPRRLRIREAEEIFGLFPQDDS